MHSFKHAAMLQYTLPHNPHPLLLRVDKKAGHGAGKSTEKRCELSYCLYSAVINPPSGCRRLQTNGDSLHNPWVFSGKIDKLIFERFS